MQCGPVRHTIGADASRSSQPLAQRVVRRDTSFDPSTLPADPHIQEVFTVLAADEARTEMIAKDTLELAAKGRRPMAGAAPRAGGRRGPGGGEERGRRCPGQGGSTT
jgi:hypothetical protein